MNKQLLSAIILSFVGISLFVLVLPQYDAIKVAKEAIGVRRSLVSERALFFDKVQELDRQARIRQSDTNKIESFIPERKQIDEVVSSIQEISEQSGLQLSGITTSEVTATEGLEYKKIFISIDITGVYPAFVNFLKNLEQSLRLYDVSEVAAASSTTSPGNVNCVVKMNAYYLK